MPKIPTVVFLVAIVLLPACTYARDECVLVRDGQPMAAIFVPSEMSYVVMQAATSFQSYVRKITGTELPILAEEGFRFHETDGLEKVVPQLNSVFIGPCEATAAAGIDPAGLPPEGYRILSNRRALYIVGRDDDMTTEKEYRKSSMWTAGPNRQHGTMHGVYAFIEEELGVRWLFPGALGEIVPKRKNLGVGKLDRTDAPRLQYRLINPPPHVRNESVAASRRLGITDQQRHQFIFDHDKWMQRMRLGTVGGTEMTHGHYMFWLRHGREHPEYFALRTDGTRANPNKSGKDAVRLCLSNDACVEAFAGLLSELFAKNPNLKIVGYSPDDYSDRDVPVCVCEECLAMGPAISDRYAIFYSEVAAIVAREFPDRYVANFAYGYYMDAPTTVGKLHPNFLVLIVGYNRWAGAWAGGDDDEIRERSLGHSLRWAGIAGKIIWRPNLFIQNEFAMPRVYAHKLADDYRQLYATGKMIGVQHDHFYAHWGAEGLDYYLAVKLAWNPTADVDALIDDYCRAGFGAAAGTIRTYFDTVEAHTNAIAAQRYSRRAHLAEQDRFIRRNSGMPVFLGELHKQETLDQWQRLLRQAVLEAAGDTEVLRRIEMLQVAVAALSHTIAIHDLECAIIFKVRDPQRREIVDVLNAAWTFASRNADTQGIHMPYAMSVCGLFRLREKWGLE